LAVFNGGQSKPVSVLGVPVMNGLGAAGRYKGMFSRAPVSDILDIFENADFCGCSGFEELDKIDEGALPRSPNGKSDGAGGFSHPLSVIQMHQTETFVFDDTGLFPCIINGDNPLILK
jgi:hypothetical protein